MDKKKKIIIAIVAVVIVAVAIVAVIVFGRKDKPADTAVETTEEVDATEDDSDEAEITEEDNNLDENQVMYDEIIYHVDPGTKTAFVESCEIFDEKDVVIRDTVEYEGVEYPVTSIEDSVFNGFDSILSVVLGENIESVADDAFYSCYSLKSVSCDASLKTIGANAFSACDELVEVKLNEGLEYIGDDAFSADPKIKEIVLPSTIDSVGTTVFMDCENLSKVTLTEGMSELGDGMFTNCYAITSISIPASIDKIPDECFWSCEGLKGSFEIPSTIRKIGDNAFYDTYITELTVPKGLLPADDTAFMGFDGMDELLTIKVPAAEKGKYEELYDGYDVKVVTY